MFADSVDTAKNCMELGVQKGRQRHLKDIISWVKKRRRHIRREDLLAFLCGKNPPQRTKVGSSMRHSSAAKMERTFPRFPSADSIPRNAEADLQCFREAIALQGNHTCSLHSVKSVHVLSAKVFIKAIEN